MDDPGLTPLLAVKSKLGELDAVLNTRAASPPTIMVELLDSVTNPEGDTVKKIVRAGTDAVRAGRSLWLDTTWLSESSSLGAIPGGPFEHFDAKIDDATEGELPFSGIDVPPLIPVVSATTDDRELNRIRLLCGHKPRQIAVRSRKYSRRSRTELIRNLERITRTVGVCDRDVHLVLDEGYIEQVDEHDIHSLVTTIVDVCEHYEIASISVLAGSAPPQRKAYETHLRQRPELELWLAVGQNCQYPLRYGDYGVVHPLPREGRGPGWPNPYIHYTVPNGSLFVARRIPDRGPGAPPKGASEKYFLEVAEELVQSSEFAGERFSWGDRTLYRCRRSSHPRLGKSTKWIAIATSHHIAHLSQRHGSGGAG